MTAASAGGSRRARILAYLEAHPGLTGSELDRVLGTGPSTWDLLRAMERKGQVIAALEWRPRQGRHVSLWYVAPPGTVPPARAEPAGAAEWRRRRSREAQRRRRARARGVAVTPGGPAPLLRDAGAPGPVAAVVLLPGAACRGADPDLFFGAEGETPADRQAREARAKAVCARCPVRRGCYDLARANGEPWGIWGGVAFDRMEGREAS